MKQRRSLSETLQNLMSSGYRFADAQIAALPDESLQSDDWRLDSVARIRQETEKGVAALVIAVSSAHRQMKLVFVEVVSPKNEFSLMALVRRLFPTQQRTNFYLSPVAL